MHLIFLDIDGVLNSSQFAIKHYEETGKGLFMWDFIDPSRVDLLVKFLESHRGEVWLVISSSWRENNLKDTVEFFKEHENVAKIADYIVGVTPRLNEGVRGDEIDWFLTNIRDKDKIGKYVKGDLHRERIVIVDDEDDMLDYQFPRFVHVDGNVGLTEMDIEKITWLLYGG